MKTQTNSDAPAVGQPRLVLRLREHAENAFVKYTAIEDDLNAAADLLEELYPLTADLFPQNDQEHPPR